MEEGGEGEGGRRKGRKGGVKKVGDGAEEVDQGGRREGRAGGGGGGDGGGRSHDHCLAYFRVAYPQDRQGMD